MRRMRHTATPHTAAVLWYALQSTARLPVYRRVVGRLGRDHSARVHPGNTALHHYTRHMQYAHARTASFLVLTRRFIFCCYSFPRRRSQVFCLQAIRQRRPRLSPAPADPEPRHGVPTRMWGEFSPWRCTPAPVRKSHMISIQPLLFLFLLRQIGANNHDLKCVFLPAPSGAGMKVLVDTFPEHTHTCVW